MKFSEIWFFILAAVTGVSLPVSAKAEIVSINSIANVMTGSSSSGNDQVWLRVPGQLPGVPLSCVWSGGSLFYVPNDGGLGADKAMAALLSAKLSGTPVVVAYTIMGMSSDLWGFGITNCRIDQLSVGN